VQRAAQYVQQAARQVQTALEGVPELGCLRHSSLDSLAGGLLLDLFSGQGLTEAVVQERAWQARLSMSLVKAQLEVAQRWCADNKATHARHAAELQASRQQCMTGATARNVDLYFGCLMLGSSGRPLLCPVPHTHLPHLPSTPF